VLLAVIAQKLSAEQGHQPAIENSSWVENEQPVTATATAETS